MKLRNKKTGGLATLEVHEDCLTLKTDAGRHDYNSLAELNEEWEDYEKPKHDYYFIRDGGNIDCHWYQKLGEITERRKEIGNSFETKEEAEKAVERLRAWKRLKDKGFRFSKDWVYRYDQPKVENHTYFELVAICEDGIRFEDLDLLFGGEDDKS